MEQQKKMSLAAWLHMNKITNEEMARRVGCNWRYISDWRNGKLPKAVKVARAIEIETKGVVTLEQLVSEHRKKKSKDTYENQDE